MVGEEVEIGPIVNSLGKLSDEREQRNGEIR